MAGVQCLVWFVICCGGEARLGWVSDVGGGADGMGDGCARGVWLIKIK